MYSGFEIRNASEKDIDQILEITASAFVKYKELANTQYELPALKETREIIADDIKNKLDIIWNFNSFFSKYF